MDSPTEGISVHSMRLKVLYTFDAEHKNNHLARFPRALDIQTAFVDEVTQIGVIDLRTCLQAVTEASPELLSNLDNDFTIYAYDYSEEDTPLVGQGLLSRKMQETAENDSENMITGRITKNVMGLFAKNAQETLEVKLRFNPVAPPNDYRSNGSRRGSMSGQDTNVQSWAMSGQALQRSASPVVATGLETMQRMLTEGGPPRDRSGSFVGAEPFYGRADSRPPSRPGTPTLLQPFNPPVRQSTSSGSRPSSRAGVHQRGHARRDSFNSGYYSGEDAIEEGPAKKRAKITKIKQPKKSDLNIERQPDSLRVVASSASSLRIHRPTPVNPALAMQRGTFAEEPVRPPTPVPVKAPRPRGRPRKHVSSNLNRSRARPSSPATEPASQNISSELPDGAVSSPEDNRQGSPLSTPAKSTPANFPSSPPIMPDHASADPSSPGLPPMLGDHDSGFMSSNFDDLFGGEGVLHFDDFLNDQTDTMSGVLDAPVIQISLKDLNTEYSEIQVVGSQLQNLEPEFQNTDSKVQHVENGEPTPATNTYAPVFDEANDVDETSAIPLPHPKLLIEATELRPPTQPLSRSQSFAPGSNTRMSSPKLGSASMPPTRQIEDGRRAMANTFLTASDPSSRNLHRSNTWAGDMSDLLTSDAPVGDETRTRNGSRKRVGKDQTRARLEAAIAAGELPPYCDNCGAIETPAWRRAYRRDFSCPYDDVETSLDDGACNYKEATEWNEDGSVKAFKGYKTTKRVEDTEEWVAISLCNPCGLWFHKQKCMRPQEKWQKRDPAEKKKRKARTKSRKGATKKNDGGVSSKSDAATPASDGSSPDDTATEAADADDRDNNEDNGGEGNEPELPQMPRLPRASSAEPVIRVLRFGMAPSKQSRPGARATQSSPVLHHGSAKAPIELDLTPRPLRRQLFPSPGKAVSRSEPVDGGRPSTDNLPAFVRRSPRLNKTVDILGLSTPIQPGLNTEQADVIMGDGLDDLFNHNGVSHDVQLPPTTPTPKRRSERILFKTPSKTPQRMFGDMLSPNVLRPTPGLLTPKMVSSRHPALAALLGMNKTPKNMTPFTRSIHDALAEVASHHAKTSPQGPPGNQLRDTPKQRGVENNLTFDFPDLPSLKGSSPMSNNPMMQFDFSELTTDHLNTDFNDVFSTDAPIPSSPPTSFFNFINSQDDDSEGFWGGLGLDAGGFEQNQQAIMLEPSPGAVLRRSPRKRD